MRELIVGADPFPPYQYYDEANNICGTDYEVVKAAIDKMNCRAKFIIDEWQAVEKSFANKEIDLVFQVQKTPEREKNYYFSSKLRDATTSIITSAKRTDQGDINELLANNCKIGVIEGYMYGDVIDSIDIANKSAFASLDDLLQSVNEGETKYGVVDYGVFNYINRENKYCNVKLLSKLNFNRPLYVAFHDKALRDEFDQYLKLFQNKS